jgi:N-acetylmuramoyl-L-alanine amidase
MREPETARADLHPERDEFSARLAQAAARNQEHRSEAEMAAETGDPPAMPPDRGPVGQGERTLRQGECIASLAHESGHLWDTIWKHAANSELRDVRKDPYVLLPGDRVTIPPIRRKSEGGQTEMRHRFRKKGQPEQFRVRVLEDDEPRRNEPYRLAIDGGEPTQGTTDAEGQVIKVIPADARKAVLAVGEGKAERVYEFALGGLDPLSETSGVQGRLAALGFDCGPVDGKLGPRTRDALREYQRSRKLRPTGVPDDATRARLKEDYGC